MAEIRKVIGSTGKAVEIEILNLTEILSYLHELGFIPTDKAGAYLIQAGQFVQNELQASILGERDEPRSVRTGRLANSIVVEPLQIEGHYAVKIKASDLSFYPEGLSTADVLKLLAETKDRHHVIETRERTKAQVIEILKGNIIEAIKMNKMRGLGGY